MNYTKFIAIAVFSLSFSLLAATETLSDSVSVSRPRLGIQAGPTFSNVNGPSDVSTSNRTGIAVGLALDVPMTNYVSLQPELMYERRGVELGSVSSARFVANYDSLQIPLFLKVKFAPDSSPFLIGGPRLTINLNKSVEVQIPAGSTSVGFDARTYELGVAVGGGVDIGPIFATIRYHLGLTDLDENSTDWKSRGLDILAGVRI